MDTDDDNTANETNVMSTVRDIITHSRGNSGMTSAFLSTASGQKAMSTTPTQFTASSLTFSTTVVALMVCIPLAVLALIIIAVCICIRRGANRQGSETYEDFSKVDQSAMMRMSMYNALEDEHAAFDSEVKNTDHPEENGYTVKNSDAENKLKDSYELQNNGNLTVDESRTNEINGDQAPNSDEVMKTDNNFLLEDNMVTENKELGKMDSSVQESDHTNDVQLREHIRLQSELSSTTSPGSKAVSGDYYTLKANFIPPPE